MHEAFGGPYELPNRTAYNETCANIASAMWDWRMLSVTGDAKYADAMERVLYNSMLSSMQLDGRSFFYSNPLHRCGPEVPLEERFGAAPGGYHARVAGALFLLPSSVARTIANCKVGPTACPTTAYGCISMAAARSTRGWPTARC